MLQFKSANRVRNIHKVLDGKNVWFLANPENKTKHIEFELNGKFKLKQWNPHTGTISKLPSVEYKKSKTIIRMDFNGINSLFLVKE